jgi:large subunit ribosomal protein L27
MAHKKGQGSSRNGRDSPGQHRGIKVYGGEYVIPGNILVRQVGTVVHPGRNVGMGRDFTIFATVEGTVKYERYGKDRKRVSVVPVEAPKAEAPKAEAPKAEA